MVGVNWGCVRPKYTCTPPPNVITIPTRKHPCAWEQSPSHASNGHTRATGRTCWQMHVGNCRHLLCPAIALFVAPCSLLASLFCTASLVFCCDVGTHQPCNPRKGWPDSRVQRLASSTKCRPDVRTTSPLVEKAFIFFVGGFGRAIAVEIKMMTSFEPELGVLKKK